MIKRISIYLLLSGLLVFPLVACNPKTATESSAPENLQDETKSEIGQDGLISMIPPDSLSINEAKQAVQEYCETSAEEPWVLSFDFINAEVNWMQTNMAINQYWEGQIAEREGWDDDTLLNHFLAVVATYDAEYSEEAVWEPSDGRPGVFRIQMCYFLVEDSDGVWAVWSGTPYGVEKVEG